MSTKICSINNSIDNKQYYYSTLDCVAISYPMMKKRNKNRGFLQCSLIRLVYLVYGTLWCRPMQYSYRSTIRVGIFVADQFIDQIGSSKFTVVSSSSSSSSRIGGFACS